MLLPLASYSLIRTAGFNKHSAIWAALLSAIHPHLIFHSQNSRPYTIALLLSLLSFRAYLRWLKSPNGKLSVTHIISTACVVYIHFFFVITWAIQILHYLSLQHRPALKEWFKINGSIALLQTGSVLIAYLAWLHQPREYLQWVPPNSLRFFTTALSGFIHPAFLALLICGLIIMHKKQLLQRTTFPKLRPFPLMILWFFIPILFCFALSGLSGHSFLENRYALLCAFVPIFLYSMLLGSSEGLVIFVTSSRCISAEQEPA
tara:strand:- start:165 stop:947 length:783 start_codon:yes stop_codon:yes gene_type:complete